ncbi:MAG: ABC transporter permease [Bacteroidaceae bacterium]|nr:ABC transporter permease [Bacteroidaceae bacterium]
MILPYLINKELRQIMRNRALPVVFLLLPLALGNMIPRLATQEVRGLRLAVIDSDHSSFSRRLTQKIDASGYISLACSVSSYKEAISRVSSGEADVILSIPHGYERGFLTSGEPPVVQVHANAVNGTKGAMASAYISQIVSLFSQDIAHEQGCSPPASDSLKALSVRFLFNPYLDYKLFMVPAVLAMLLILIVGFLPALNIVSEKEKGTIEQINVSPISRSAFILSKITPYILIGVLMVVEALVVVRVLFGISCAGSIPLLLFSSLLFSMLMASLGLVISNYASTLRQAALTMWFFLMVFLLMSGMVTPIASMPEWAQSLTLLNPMRYFITVARSIFIRGSGFTQLLPQFLALLVMAVCGWIWAILSYRKSR